MAVQTLFYRLLLPGFVQSSTLVSFHCSFFFKRFINVQVVQPYNSTETATIWKLSFFLKANNGQKTLKKFKRGFREIYKPWLIFEATKSSTENQPNKLNKQIE